MIFRVCSPSINDLYNLHAPWPLPSDMQHYKCCTLTTHKGDGFWLLDLCDNTAPDVVRVRWGIANTEGVWSKHRYLLLHTIEFYHALKIWMWSCDYHMTVMWLYTGERVCHKPWIRDNQLVFNQTTRWFIINMTVQPPKTSWAGVQAHAVRACWAGWCYIVHTYMYILTNWLHSDMWADLR